MVEIFQGCDDEFKRLEALDKYHILDSGRDADFDDLTKLAALLFEVPIATVTILDKNRQWFKSSVGLDVSETPREISFCTHAINQVDPLIVENTLADTRFKNNPLVVDDPKLRFYAGIPLRTEEGHAIGTFCIMDRVPRSLSETKLDLLKTLANQALQLLELRKERNALKQKVVESERIREALESYSNHLTDAQRIAKIGSWELNFEDDLLTWSDEIYRIFDIDKNEFGANFEAFISRVHPDDKEALLAAQKRVINGEAKLDIEHRIILRDGNIRYVHERAELKSDSKTSNRILAGTVQDITEKKQIELERELLLTREKEATQRAESTMEYFRAIFENSPGVYLVLSPEDYSILAVSNAYLDATMSSREKIIGKRLLDIIAPASKHDLNQESEALLNSLDRVKSTGELDAMPIQRFPIRTPNGELITKYWSSINSPILNQDKKVIFIIHRVEDVTEIISNEGTFLQGENELEKFNFKTTEVILKALEQQKLLSKLRASEERFKLVARISNDAIWDWNLLDDSIWWNNGMEKLFGFSMSTIEPNIKSWTNRIHPEDLERVERGIYAVINSENEYWTDEYRFAKSDGSYSLVEDRGIVIRSDDGQPIRMVGGMTDITLKKADERKLKVQAGLLDQARDAIIVRSLEHDILYWNKSAERLYGYTEVEAKGSKIQDLLYPDDDSEFIRATNIALSDGYWNGKITQSNKVGKKLTVDANWSLVRDDKGAPEAIFAINTDITEKIELEQRLLHAQKLESIGQLTGGIAHDFNNLLTVIIGNSQLLKDSFEESSKYHQLAQMILTAGDRGAELTQRLLAFARRQALEPKVVNVQESIVETIKLLNKTIGANVAIKFIRSMDLWNVFIDPGHLDSALMNLCLNARDAMPSGGNIVIETANVVLDDEYSGNSHEVVAGEYVMLAVTDKGIGMSIETLTRAFEPFFTTKPKGRGTGLGLSMVYGFTKQSGGHIKIYSEVGHGTSVKLYLPKANDGEKIQINSIPSHPNEGGNERILLVEDDDLLRLHATQSLEELGYEVVAVSNGIEALEVLVKDVRFDLLFTDVVMPGGLNGPELVAEVKKILPSLPVLFTSGYTENAILHHGKVDVGINLLHKPYRKQMLAKKIRETLASNNEYREVPK
jgi:PAS domain S-box-containing protein